MDIFFIDWFCGERIGGLVGEMFWHDKLVKVECDERPSFQRDVFEKLVEAVEVLLFGEHLFHVFEDLGVGWPGDGNADEDADDCCEGESADCSCPDGHDRDHGADGRCC